MPSARLVLLYDNGVACSVPSLKCGVENVFFFNVESSSTTLDDEITVRTLPLYVRRTNGKCFTDASQARHCHLELNFKT